MLPAPLPIGIWVASPTHPEASFGASDFALRSQAERRRNRTFQPPGYDGLPVLKTGWLARTTLVHEASRRVCERGGVESRSMPDAANNPRQVTAEEAVRLAPSPPHLVGFPHASFVART